MERKANITRMGKNITKLGENTFSNSVILIFHNGYS
jgi:hypothetical protein